MIDTMGSGRAPIFRSIDDNDILYFGEAISARGSPEEADDER